MKLRKLIVLALVLAMVICAFVACGETSDTDTQAPDTQDTDTNAPESESQDPGTDTEKECTHELEVEEKLATCTDRGYKKETCKLCGEVVTDTAYPRTAHTASGAATCDTDSKCTVCGEVLEAAKGHAWGDVTTVAATCKAAGKETKTCTVCNKTEETEIAPLEHVIENVTSSVPGTCTTAGSETGICALCGETQTVVLPAEHVVTGFGDLTKLTFVDGKIQAKCSACKQDVIIDGNVRLSLPFEAADVPTELAKWATATNTFPYDVSYNSGQAGTAGYVPQITAYADATDGHTSVLRVHHNASPVVQFNGDLLADSNYYVISFDWRATKISGTSNKIGAFGMVDSFVSGVVNENDFSFAFKIDRSTGELFDTSGKQAFNLSVVAGQWYEVVVVVDNATGTAYTYIDGVCYSVVQNENYLVVDGGEYTWRFGGLYQVFHLPEFDNFEVVAIKTSAAQGGSDVEGDEEGNEDEDEDDGTGCAHQCYLQVQLPTPTVPGFIKRTCNICDRVVTYEILTHICYSETPADCVNDSPCDECGEVIEEAWGHALDPEQPVTVTPGAIPCVDMGTKEGFCVVCQQPVTEQVDPLAHTFDGQNIDLDNLTFDADGNIMLPCTTCGTTLVVPEDVRLSLNFDATLNKEIKEQATDANGLATGSIYASDQSGAPDPEVTGSVLSVKANKSAGVSFNAALLSDADHYLISFKWRVVGLHTGSRVVGVFGLSNPAKLGAANETDYSYALWMNRNTGVMQKNGKVAGNFSLTVEANKWYDIVIAVDNVSGYHYVYIDGDLFSVVENAEWLVKGNGTYTFRFGGVYNVTIMPQFDDFKVSVLEASCRHAATTEEPALDPTCTAKGLANLVCTECGEIVGTKEIDMLDHTPGEVTDADYAGCAYKAKCAVCSDEYLFAKANAEHVLSANASITVVGDKVYGECKDCGMKEVPGSENDLIVLNFDQTDVATELAALPNASTYGFAYGTVYGANGDTPVCTVSTIGQRTVLLVAPPIPDKPGQAGNHTPLIKFNGDMLKDTPYYVVTFDVQYVGAGISSTSSPNMTLFGLYQLTSNEMPSGQKTLVSTTNAALVANRKQGELAILNANLSASKSVTSGTWYTVTLIVDNATGNSDIYVDGTYLGSNTNGKMLIEAGKDYVWVLGGQYVNQHRPAFDNFKVYALGYECAHATKNTVTVTDSTCTTEGTTKLVCAMCGADCGAGANIPVKPHEASDVVVEDKSCYTVYACTGAATGCTEYVTVAKEGATHNVAAPTTFDSTTVVKDGKVQGACADCGLYFDAPITEDVRLFLDFDKDTLADELAEANAAANTLFGTTGVTYIADNTDGGKPSRYIIKEVNGEKGLYSGNDTPSSDTSRLFLQYNGSLMADSTYYMISFDWRFGQTGQSGECNIFSAYYSTTTATGANVCKFDRSNSLFFKGVEYPTDGTKIAVNTWYHFDVIVNSATGSALVYINNEYAGTVSSTAFKPAVDQMYNWRFGEGSVGHKPQYDNFKVEVLAKAVVTE